MQDLKKAIVGAVVAAAVSAMLPEIALADTGVSGKTDVCKDSGIRKADQRHLYAGGAHSGTRDLFTDGGRSRSNDVHSEGV